jgi:creatinine amidohydrolase
MSPDSYALEALTWPEAGRLLARDSRLLFPVGALEQHGPHLPLGTNTFLAEAVARRVSDELGILRAPTFPYGVTGGGRGRYAATTTLRRKTLHRAVNELLASWEDHGVSEIVVITAHRYEPHLDALLMALTSRSRTTVIDLYAVEVGDLLETEPELEIGGELETSLMLHLAPERVRRDQVTDLAPDPRDVGRYVRHRMPTPPAGSPGVLGFPTLATAEKGRALFDRWVEAITELLARPRRND